MKLIVLYGDENSGKTITLKMVYEKLKAHNLLETHCFKYYDDDARHNDFRDVLVLSKDTNNNRVEWLDGTNSQDIKDAFPDGDDVDSMTFNDVELNDMGKIVSSEEDDEADETDVLESVDEIECDEDLVSINTDSKYLLQVPDVNKLIADTANLKAKDLILVGMSLEGDYGFEHDKKDRSSWTWHNRNLYKNLKELLFCDTIVCACSILDGSKTAKEKPVNCIIKFLHDFAASHSIKFRVFNSISHGKDGWNKKLKDNESIANQIVSLI